MIRINFCKTGASVPDWDIDEEVERLKLVAEQNATWTGKMAVYQRSNFLLLDALRAEIAEDKISLDNICFSVDDVPLQLNEYGAPLRWPKEAGIREEFGARILKAAVEKRKAKKLRSCGGSEAYKNVEQSSDN